MSSITKVRKSSIDDRHQIRSPLENGDPKDVRIWGDTLKKTRINKLFATESGLAGHVTILQNEFNRITPERLNGCSLEIIEAAYEVNRGLRTALTKTVKAAKDSKFPLPKAHYLRIPLLNDIIVI